ncbi:ATP-binding cassette domain-containing protein [Candidatus Rickettsiella viridis]|uniref:ATP-binding cassette domain-containing protein n=1 Tax=Candidatus Rickettsiella viridis TaxID=676208 RepID=UPI0022B2A602|nr:ATP-binding cassette domain-containing protein [Candidatus Rickettsiella viridis]
MKNSPAITISNACLQYQNQILFDQLNFHIPAGQTTCLLGPSGIGKTSFLQLIAKLNTSAYADITASDQQSLQSRIAYRLYATI